MRVALVGATGFIGSAVCEALAARGDDLTVLARNPERSRSRLPASASVIYWDGLSAPANRHLADADAVVNLAGEPLVGRWTAAKKRRIRESRLRSTGNLVEALASLPPASRPDVLVNGSAVGYYGDRGDEILTEESAPGSGFLAGVCVDWEREAERARALGLRVVRVRTSLVLGEGGIMQRLLPIFRVGLGCPIGDGQQWMPWIHIADEVGLILSALDDKRLDGPINATAPEQVTNAAFSQSLAHAVGRRCLLAAPKFAVRLALGEMSGLLLDGQRVTPARALEQGYGFRYPTLSGALRALLDRE